VVTGKFDMIPLEKKYPCKRSEWFVWYQTAWWCWDLCEW